MVHLSPRHLSAKANSLRWQSSWIFLEGLKCFAICLSPRSLQVLFHVTSLFRHKESSCHLPSWDSFETPKEHKSLPLVSSNFIFTKARPVLAVVTSNYYFIVYCLFPFLENKLPWGMNLAFPISAISPTLKPSLAHVASKLILVESLPPLLGFWTQQPQPFVSSPGRHSK